MNVKLTNIDIEGERERERERKRERLRQTDRQTHKKTDRHSLWKKETDRQTID